MAMTSIVGVANNPSIWWCRKRYSDGLVYQYSAIKDLCTVSQAFSSIWVLLVFIRLLVLIAPDTGGHCRDGHHFIAFGVRIHIELFILAVELASRSRLNNSIALVIFLSVIISISTRSLIGCLQINNPLIQAPPVKIITGLTSRFSILVLALSQTITIWE